MTEPYQKTGRGGAGNFYSKADIQPQPQAQPTDLESQSQPQSQRQPLEEEGYPLKSTAISSQQQQQQRQQPPEYAHTGRGGAGNWMKPPPLSQPSDLPLTKPALNASTRGAGAGAGAGMGKQVYRGGRGGAGNYDWGAGEERRVREEEEGRRMVRGEVESALRGLRRPGRVVVGDDARKRGGRG